MLNLLTETNQLVARLEQLSNRRVEFMRVDSLPVLASLKIARNGADFSPRLAAIAASTESHLGYEQLF